MYVQFNIPELKAVPRSFPEYWLQVVFLGGVSDNFQVGSLVTSYIRLTEAALAEYDLGRDHLLAFWGTHESVNLGALNRSISHFESFLSDVYRAIECFRRLRGHVDLTEEWRELFRWTKPRFASDFVSNRVRAFRHQIHHVESYLMDGRIQRGQPVSLNADGDEVPHPEEENQTIKTIDRLVMGKEELQFTDLASWLTEMAGLAKAIAKYVRSVNDPEQDV